MQLRPELLCSVKIPHETQKEQLVWKKILTITCLVYLAPPEEKSLVTELSLILTRGEADKNWHSYWFLHKFGEKIKTIEKREFTRVSSFPLGFLSAAHEANTIIAGNSDFFLLVKKNMIPEWHEPLWPHPLPCMASPTSLYGPAHFKRVLKTTCFSPVYSRKLTLHTITHLLSHRCSR